MKKIILASLFAAAGIHADVTLHKTLPHITLQSDDGGYFKGKAWDSSMLKGKTTMLMYVDPDENSKGEPFKPTIEKLEKEMNFKKFQIVVVLNTGATWKPNLVIKKLMKDKLKTYPKRQYVFDNNSILSKKWGLKSDEYNVVIIDKNMKPVAVHSGKWNAGEIEKIEKAIRKTAK